ncbi:MFS transporter [Euzebya tangerina]|uniref:MFS transporter n=1 Tax=Euzebya tangerina TaxID=591198 RepID=UPI000E31E1A2
MSASPSPPVDTEITVHAWRHPSVLAAAAFSIYAGFAQFTATAALPDIAEAFDIGVPGSDASIVEQAGLGLGTLGIALGIIRLASVAALPVARQADRLGRRRVLLVATALTLGLTAAGAISPSFWPLIIILAVARPLASAVNAVAGVIAAEEVATRDRSKALAVITAGYGIGAGAPVLLRGLTDGAIGYRAILLVAIPLLATIPLVARLVDEPARAKLVISEIDPDSPAAKRLGRVPRPLVGRLALLCGLGFVLAFLTGPVNTYLFLYGEAVVGLSPAMQTIILPIGGVLGGVGLLFGIWLADEIGRIPTAMWTKFALAGAGVLTYSAGAWGAAGGYVATLFIGSSYAPAVAATAAEIFPTSIRGTAAGWVTLTSTIGAVAGLITFGLVAEATGSFSTAAWVVSVPTAVSVIGYRYLPETMGLELEESAPEVVS